MKVTDLLESEDQKFADLAAAWVKIHNEASRKFTEAFKKVGAKMWPQDEAHPLKPKHEVEIAKNMQSLGPKIFSKLTRPLTVLDSYPDVTNQQRASLDREVNQILKTYQKKLDEIMNAFK